MHDEMTGTIDVPSVEQIVSILSTEIGGPLPSHLALLAKVAPSSVQGYYKMWRELMREPSEGGALPKRYKALICVSLATATRNREAAVFWSRVAARWGLQFEELREIVCFNVTGQGMSTFLDIGQHCLAAALEEIEKLGDRPAPEPIEAFVTPEAWKSVALPTSDLPLAERPAVVAPNSPAEVAIHEYFEKSFDAPMPEFWARLGRESSALLEGYFLLRKDNMLRPEAGGAAPKVVKELNAVAVDTALHNPWGGEVHLRAAMLNGATLKTLREIEGLVIMEVGMVIYKMTGFDFILYAEKIAAALDTAQ